MNIFSRRKRLLNRTSARVNPASRGFIASGNNRLRRALSPNRAGTPAMPKMSSRRQFHRALRRHPAWPMVMEQAAARAKAHKEQEAARAKVHKEQEAARAQAQKAVRRGRIRRNVRRNRALVLALVAVGALVALLNGIGAAQFGIWRPHRVSFEGTLPTGRFGAATAFDQNSQEMLMFGGFIAGPPGAAGTQGTPVAAAETWVAAEGRNPMWASRGSVRSPSPRGYASMAYDAARRNTVLFGGGTKYGDPTAVSDETWIYNGSDWTLADPPGPRPSARQNASMVYDAHRKVVVLFGGRGADGKAIAGGPLNKGNPTGDTWIWDGSAWEKQETPTLLSPGPRHSAAMAYDICRGEAVLFGGTQGDGVNSLDTSVQTWIWDGKTWRVRPFLANLNGVNDPSSTPAGRYGASMLYSYTSGQVMLYGGFIRGEGRINTPSANKEIPVATDDNVWIWDGTAWKKNLHNPQILFGIPLEGHVYTPPPPRAYASFGYLRQTGSSRATFDYYGLTLLFGGTPADLSPAPQVVYSDAFTFNEGGALPVDLPKGCADPVPLPPDEVSVGGPSADSVSKEPIRNEIREIAQLPVLFGAVPNPIQDLNHPQNTPQPPCPRPSGLDQAGQAFPDHQENVGNTHLVTDPKRNRIYQFFRCDQDNSYIPNQTARPVKILIEAYDAKTLRSVGSALASLTYPTNTPSWEWQNMFHDVDRGHFLLKTTYYDGSANAIDLLVIEQDLIEKGVNPTVRRYRVSSTSPVPQVGFFNHPKTGRPKALISLAGSNPVDRVTGSKNPNNPASTRAKIVQLDLETNLPDWEAPLEACLPTGQPEIPPGKAYRVGNTVYASCNTSGSTWGVVRIPIDDSEKPGTPETFPGPASVTRTWIDHPAERMLLMSEDVGTTGGTVLWVFDLQSSRYVGRSGLGPGASQIPSSGLDQATGRFYILVKDAQKRTTGDEGAAQIVQGGLLVVDTRLTPVPQPINFTQFSSPSSAEMGILPPEFGLPTRIFMRRSGGTVKRYPDGQARETLNDLHYKVLADELPVPKQPKFDAQDTLTIPVAESLGKTEVSFDAEGSGFGMRLRRVGGITHQGDQTDPPCLHPDRQLMAGWVAQAHLSDLVTSARSVGLEADSNTKSDLEGLLSRCNVPPTAVGNFAPPQAKPSYDDTLWPALTSTLTQIDSVTGPNLVWDKRFEEVECTGDSSFTTQTVAADAYGSAKCEQTLARVEGKARGSVLGSDAAGFSVGEGYSNVVVTREPERGVVVTATAVAKVIKLPGISIDLVKTEAVSWSNGRPFSGDRGTFTRAICGVTISPAPDKHPGYSNPGCIPPNQQAQFITEWNKGWGTRSKITLPAPDPNLLKGTPGGYSAGVVKPLTEEVETELLAAWDVQKEVVGLRIMFTVDHFNAPEKQILDLAAVRAVTGFGVQCNSDLVYSPSAKSCVALPEEVFEDEPIEEEEEFFSEDDGPELYAAGGWEPVETTGAPEGLALGTRLGRFIENLPVLRQLPIRQMGEALLAASVWFLFLLPPLLASRRFALTLARRS